MKIKRDHSNFACALENRNFQKHGHFEIAMLPCKQQYFLSFEMLPVLKTCCGQYPSLYVSLTKIIDITVESAVVC